eukprot:GDKJ01059595.1.p1 GENE.GDKJ01059595.1~~GDKJ01059595.1.p1  ORF type:complete len:444 (-),score=42.61 GDKJ01059595.1:312-1643(-)
MKSLVSVAILLVLIAQVVSATDLCPTGSLAGETEFIVINILTTDTYIANECRIIHAKFYISLPESESNTYVTVENSTILSYPLSFTSYEPLGPFSIVIKNNLFNLNAYLYVTGELTPNTSVTIQGNTMSANDETWDVINLIVINSVNLFANASLNIVNNVLNVSNQNADQTLTIYFIGSTLLDPFSSVNILRNTITATGNIQGTLISIESSAHADNSTWRVMDNILTSTSTSTVTAYSVNGLNGDSSAVYVFSNNIVNFTNTVQSSGGALYFQNPSLVLLSVDNNQIYYNGENAIYFGTIDRLSGLSISGNAIHSTNVFLFSPVIMAAYLNFRPNATYVMSNNNATSTSVTITDAPLLNVDNVTFTNYYYRYVDSPTKIQYCGNTLPWSNEPTAEQLFSSELLDYVVSSCNEVTRPASSTPLRSIGGSAFGIVISVVVAQLLW